LYCQGPQEGEVVKEWLVKSQKPETGLRVEDQKKGSGRLLTKGIKRKLTCGRELREKKPP